MGVTIQLWMRRSRFLLRMADPIRPWAAVRRTAFERPGANRCRLADKQDVLELLWKSDRVCLRTSFTHNW